MDWMFEKTNGENNMDEQNAYAEGFADAIVIVVANVHKTMRIFEECVKEILDSQHNFYQYDDNFKKMFMGKVEEFIKANVVQSKLGEEIRLLAASVIFAFMKGGGTALHKLDENVLAQMKKTLGGKNFHDRDISDIGNN